MIDLLGLFITIYLISLNVQESKTFQSKRYLVYPNPLNSETKVQVLFGLGLPMESDDVSMTLGYVMKCNYNLPYNIPNDTQKYIKSVRREIMMQQQMEGTMQASISRWEFYRLLEMAMEASGTGKVCLLRAVCEAAKEPLLEGHGILEQLLHVILTPSTTSDEYEIYSNREYYSAEIIGRTSSDDCKSYFECPFNLIDYFTKKIL